MNVLDPSAQQIRQWGQSAIDMMAEYLANIRSRRVYPQTSSREIRSKLERDLPTEGSDFESLLGRFQEVLVEMSRHNSHPRMFGYVQSPGSALAAIADLFASTLNPNLTAWRSAPAAVEIERLTIDWIKTIVGFSENAAGLFVSGGSMANLAALAVARRAKGPTNLIDAGAAAADRPMRIYASRETHHSIVKAAGLLGIGRNNVRLIEVDEKFKIRIDRLRHAIGEDIAAGHRPICLVGNAGTVMTGACDPLRKICEVAREFDLWFHIDGSYGGFAMLAPSARPLLDGIGEADSIALDPHKWLYLPVDCGCVLYRDGEIAKATFAEEAEYTRMVGEQADEAFAFWDYGPELSRRFRALKVWMVLQGAGVRLLGEMIETNMACARRLEALVRASSDFEMLAPVELSIFCFRYVPARLKAAAVSDDARLRSKTDEELNQLNERLLVQLQRDGSSYLSNAQLNGRFALRGCVLNFRTTLQDMEILLDDVRAAFRKLT